VLHSVNHCEALDPPNPTAYVLRVPDVQGGRRQTVLHGLKLQLFLVRSPQVAVKLLRHKEAMRAQAHATQTASLPSSTKIVAPVESSRVSTEVSSVVKRSNASLNQTKPLVVVEV
jgi:hypothetical protein